MCKPSWWSPQLASYASSLCKVQNGIWPPIWYGTWSLLHMRVLGTKQEDLAKVCFDGVLNCTFIDQNVSDPVFNPVRIERIVTVVVIVVLVRDPEISTTTVLYSRRSCLALCTHSSFVSCETRGHSTRCWLALDRDSYRLESIWWAVLFDALVPGAAICCINKHDVWFWKLCL